MSALKRISLVVCLVAASGCSLLLDEPDVTECSLATHCPDGESCTSGVCVITVPDMAGLDAALPDGGAPSQEDGGPPEDMGDVMMASASDFGPAPSYPDHRCFENVVNPIYRAPGSSTYIPRGDCSRWRQIISVKENEQMDLLLRSDVDPPITLADVRGTHRVNQRYLVVPQFNPQDNATNVARFDFKTGETQWLNPRSYDQSNASLGVGFSAYIEHRNDTDRVKVQFQDDTIVDCGRDNTRQWGLVATWNRLAWFEQRAGALRPRLVVTSPENCHLPEARRERLLTAVTSLSEHALINGGDDLLWLGEDQLGQIRVWRWRYSVGGAEPTLLEGIQRLDGHPIEIAAHGRYLAMVNYQPLSPPYGLIVYDLETAELREIPTTGNVHRPTVTEHYLIWAEGGGHTGWELRYALLED